MPGVKTAEEMFHSITGFAVTDVSMLDGVHTAYNPLSSRFEIELDDNRNISYPFEYCWSKSNESKPGHSKTRTVSEESDIIDESEDEFDEMWEHSLKQKLTLDKAADFASELPVETVSDVVSKDAEFGKEMKISELKCEDKSSSGIDENP